MARGRTGAAWSYPVLLGAGVILMAAAVALGLGLLDPRHGAEGACLSQDCT